MAGCIYFPIVVSTRRATTTLRRSLLWSRRSGYDRSSRPCITKLPGSSTASAQPAPYPGHIEGWQCQAGEQDRQPAEEARCLTAVKSEGAFKQAIGKGSPCPIINVQYAAAGRIDRDKAGTRPTPPLSWLTQPHLVGRELPARKSQRDEGRLRKPCLSNTDRLIGRDDRLSEGPGGHEKAGR